MRAVFISQAVLNKNNGGGQFVRSLTGLLKKAIGADNLTVISLPDQNDTARHIIMMMLALLDNWRYLEFL